jgi:magnesium transporter
MRCDIYRDPSDEQGHHETVDYGHADGGRAAVLESLKRLGDKEFCWVQLDDPGPGDPRPAR